MPNAFLAIARRRRTQYALGKQLPLPQSEVTALIQEAVRESPSSFNSQSSRAVILFGAHSDRFWSLVNDALRPVVPADAFAQTEAKLDGFSAGAGTVLFYEDQDVVADLQTRFPLYAENFPVWSEHASAIAQYSVWTALTEAGIGASLQHYNPLPDAAVAREWDLPASWRLRAQMPFGSHEASIGEKSYIDDAVRFRVHG
ncbi:nitroreductase family protein [Luteimonas deserti]|uniref:Nitroreductase family protein n=1 Tax=Luteimonas deserti TaxID=2752306 RepID=A0A7Z0QT57_9GAMM|nr:nitroreductase family protein [Luteimonas deserti]NYZ63285.1 nitroreductase family protein [Luteimonas deserti]